MDTKREQERQELYKGIWNIANDLRGQVDGWDFKAYVLACYSIDIYLKI